MYLSRQENLQEYLRQFMAGVFGWMASALAITATTAYLVVNSRLFTYLQQHSGLLIGLIIVQFLLALGFMLLLYRLSYIQALIMFLAYAFINGILFSSIFYIYTTTSITLTFFTAAGMFGVMALYGYYTQTDLSSWGNLLMMMLVGLIIGLVVQLFLGQSYTWFNLILSGAGVIIFTMLTAYDVQRIKKLALSLVESEVSIAKITLLGALMLYLDIINLFLYLLQFMGRRRE